MAKEAPITEEGLAGGIVLRGVAGVTMAFYELHLPFVLQKPNAYVDKRIGILEKSGYLRLCRIEHYKVYVDRTILYLRGETQVETLSSVCIALWNGRVQDVSKHVVAEWHREECEE